MPMTKPQLQRFNGDAIPAFLKAQDRWALWVAEYLPEKGKYTKIPRQVSKPQYGVSTKNRKGWVDYASALKAYSENAPLTDEPVGTIGTIAGLGFLMTDIQNVVGIDLDHCRDPETGEIATWATNLVRACNSYTEISPSRKGLRIFLQADIGGPDIGNTDVGFEMYGGGAPRFLTVTGAHLPGTPTTVNLPRPGLLAQLREQYGTEKSTSASNDVEMPPVLPQHETPDTDGLALPSNIKAFLHDGDFGEYTDQSELLQLTAKYLVRAGLEPQQVLSVLCHNPFAFTIALEHRRDDEDKATAYLWSHVNDAVAKVEDMPTIISRFDVLVDAAIDKPAADDFDDVSGDTWTPPTPKLSKKEQERLDHIKSLKEKFRPQTIDAYKASIPPLRWIVKGVMPRADIGSIYGESTAGKTYAALHLCFCVALGREWFGIKTQKAKVFYVVAEGKTGIPGRIAAWCLEHGVSESELAENFRLRACSPNLLEADHAAAMAAVVTEELGSVDLLVFDTMAQTMPGANENSGEDMGRYLDFVKKVGEKTGATICLIGHAGKDTERGMRGWSGVRGAMDFECEVAVANDDTRYLAVTKLKDGEGQNMAYTFSLRDHVLDFDIEEGEVKSASLVEGVKTTLSAAKGIRRMALAEEQAQVDAIKKEARDRLKAEAGPVGRPSPRADAMQAALARLAAQGRRVWSEDDLTDVCVAELAKLDPKDGGFTLKDIEGRQQGRRVRRALEALAQKGELRMDDDGNYVITADEISPPGEDF